MISIQYLLVFWMMRIIMFSILDYEKKKSTMKINVCIVSVLLILDAVRFIIMGYHSVEWYDTPLGIGLVIFTMSYSLYIYRKLFVWIVISVSLFFSIVISSISANFFLIVLGMDPIMLTENPFISIFGMLSGLAFLKITQLLLRKLKLNIRIELLTKKDVIMVFMFLLMFGFYVGNMQILVLDYIGTFRFFLNVFSLFAGIIPIYGIVQIILQKDRIEFVEEREKQQELLFEQERQHYENIRNRDDALDAFKHDISDELNYLRQLISNNDSSSAIMHITKMQSEVNRLLITKTHYTGSVAVDSCWYHLVSSERYKNINSEWLGKFENRITIDERDLLKLLSNLLKNAFEAAYHGITEKYVHVQISNDKRLRILIVNSHNNQIKMKSNGTIKTTKLSTDNHGIGTKIIYDIVQKYNGVLRYEYDDKIFTTKIVF